MDAFLSGFASELTKQAGDIVDMEELNDIYKGIKQKAKKIKGGSAYARTKKKIGEGVDYATPLAMGGVAAPVVGVLTAILRRKLHNKQIARMMHSPRLGPVARADLKRMLHAGPVFSRNNIGKTRFDEAITTPADLAIDSGKGIALGVGYQELKRLHDAKK